MSHRLNRRDLFRLGTAAGGAALMSGALAAAGPADAAQGEEKMNVLFIAVDDLRPQLACFGNDRMISPNIDRIAARGTAFRRTYCQQAVCGPSRASVLSGMRPDSTRVWDLNTPLRSVQPDVLTLPEQFKNHGYETVSLGKIYHHGKRDDPQGWSRDPWGAPNAFPGHASAELRAEAAAARRQARAQKKRWSWRGPSVESEDLPDEQYADGALALRAVEELKRLQDGRFFLGVGFYKPHLAFACPRKYWDMYPEADIDLADNPFSPKDCPPIALHNFGELRQYSDIPRKGPVSDEKARQLIRGYYACTTFIDAQVGLVLDALDDLGLSRNTVVALWGDHGWNLGEHGLWCKHSNFETSAHSPLVISAPGQRHPGQPTDGLCEFVDIYPTVCDLAGLPPADHLEGVSLAPLMDDPAGEFKSAAFSQYPRGKTMGYSMRTDRYRYTEWKTGSRVVASELYDHFEDPGENVNIAGAASQAALVQQLSAKLKAGWRGALPQG